MAIQAYLFIGKGAATHDLAGGMSERAGGRGVIKRFKGGPNLKSGQMAMSIKV
jgi:hypothetical protein